MTDKRRSMPNTRVMLWVAFAAILYLNYEAWMHDYREPAAVAAAQSAAGARAALRRHSPIRYPRPRPANPTARPRRTGSRTPTRRRRPRGSRSRGAALPRRPAAARRNRRARSLHQPEGRRDRPRGSARSIRCTRTQPNVPVRLENPRPGDALSCCRAASSAARAKPLPRISRPGRRRKAPTCCRPERRNCACR